MARLNIAAPEFIHSETEPPNPELYFEAIGGAGGSSLTPSGVDVADIWACLISRCTEWEADFSGSATGSWTLGTQTFTQTYAGTIAYNVAITPIAGYADHPEGALLSPDSYLIQAASAGGGGPIGGVVVDNGGGPGAPHNLNYAGGTMTMTGHPVLVGTSAYFPFQFTLSITDLDSGDRSFVVGTNSSTGAMVGALTLEVFDWRNGSGVVSAVMPLYRISGFTDYTVSQSCDITLTPASGSYLLYGSGSDNSNPRWNADGSINGTPGD